MKAKGGPPYSASVKRYPGTAEAATRGYPLRSARLDGANLQPLPTSLCFGRKFANARGPAVGVPSAALSGRGLPFESGGSSAVLLPGPIHVVQGVYPSCSWRVLWLSVKNHRPAATYLRRSSTAPPPG